MAQLSKGKRISGDLRTEVCDNFVQRYRAGESIRAIASDSGRSYGFVQGLLKQAGVEFRSRGGARVRAGTVAGPAAAQNDGPVGDGGVPGDGSAPDAQPGLALAADRTDKPDKKDRTVKDKKPKKDKKGRKGGKD